jgi:hypothetical protein
MIPMISKKPTGCNKVALLHPVGFLLIIGIIYKMNRKTNLNFEKCNIVILVHLVHFIFINCNRQGRGRTMNQHTMTRPSPWYKAIFCLKRIHTRVKRMSVDKVDVFPDVMPHSGTNHHRSSGRNCVRPQNRNTSREGEGGPRYKDRK